MVSRMRQLATARENFAFETTLASRSFAPWLAELQRSGYDVHLLFLWLPSAELAVSRVAERVRLGGHDIPAHTVRRRYRARLLNFFGCTCRWQMAGSCSTIPQAGTRGGSRPAMGRSCASSTMPRPGVV
jgi:predicted ABC-type ATPase